MTDKELRRLNRAELLEILVSMKKELDSTAEENISLKLELREKAEGYKELESALKHMSRQLDGLCTAMNVKTADETENKPNG